MASLSDLVTRISNPSLDFCSVTGQSLRSQYEDSVKRILGNVSSPFDDRPDPTDQDVKLMMIGYFVQIGQNYLKEYGITRDCQNLINKCCQYANVDPRLRDDGYLTKFFIENICWQIKPQNETLKANKKCIISVPQMASLCLNFSFFNRILNGSNSPFPNRKKYISSSQCMTTLMYSKMNVPCFKSQEVYLLFNWISDRESVCDQIIEMYKVNKSASERKSRKLIGLFFKINEIECLEYLYDKLKNALPFQGRFNVARTIYDRSRNIWDSGIVNRLFSEIELAAIQMTGAFDENSPLRQDHRSK